MKNFVTAVYLISLLLSATASASAQTGEAPHLLDFLRSPRDFSVRHLYHDEAIYYCNKQGNHLPTARELAQYAMSLGAKGIAEFADGKPDDSYYRVDATQDGFNGIYFDRFYFSAEGYQHPEGEFGENEIWSASSNSYARVSNTWIAFNSATGHLYDVHWYFTYPARCAPGSGR